MTTLNEHFEAGREFYGSVPGITHPYSCELCLGPKSSTSFTNCLGCERLRGSGEIPSALEGMVVPMTSALQPGPWYNRLQLYKTTIKEYGWLLAALIHRYFETHVDDIAALLGGAPSLITVVPSKKSWVTFDTQTLRRVLRVAGRELFDVVQTLEFATGATLPRQKYLPDVFRPVQAIAGERIVLIEDTWTSGATSTSAAGALLREDAAAVLILPIARQVALEFHGDEHPYVEAARAPYDITLWPRA